jgi:hypothetical protein
VRRLCTDILWMEDGAVRAYGPAAEMAEQYINEVNREALGNQSNALQSHRGGTGEVRYVSVDIVDDAGHTVLQIATGDTLMVRASYETSCPVARPVFQVAIIDVDTGVVIATASSSGAELPAHLDGRGVIECRFAGLPLRPRQYVLRLSITDSHQLASYDLITAGPRFAVISRGRGVDGLATSGDDEDGLVTLDYEFAHYGTVDVAAARANR